MIKFLIGFLALPTALGLLFGGVHLTVLLTKGIGQLTGWPVEISFGALLLIALSAVFGLALATDDY